MVVLARLRMRCCVEDLMVLSFFLKRQCRRVRKVCTEKVPTPTRGRTRPKQGAALHRGRHESQVIRRVQSLRQVIKRTQPYGTSFILEKKMPLRGPSSRRRCRP